MSAVHYATALEEDGTFGVAARDAWKLAGDEMRRFSVREIPTTWDVPIRLGMREAELARAKRLADELEALMPGRFTALEERKRSELTAEQKAALDVPQMERTDDQHRAAMARAVALQRHVDPGRLD